MKITDGVDIDIDNIIGPELLLVVACRLQVLEQLMYLNMSCTLLAADSEACHTFINSHES